MIALSSSHADVVEIIDIFGFQRSSGKLCTIILDEIACEFGEKFDDEDARFDGECEFVRDGESWYELESPPDPRLFPYIVKHVRNLNIRGTSVYKTIDTLELKAEFNIGTIEDPFYVDLVIEADCTFNVKGAYASFDGYLGDNVPDLPIVSYWLLKS